MITQNIFIFLIFKCMVPVPYDVVYYEKYYEYLFTKYDYVCNQNSGMVYAKFLNKRNESKDTKNNQKCMHKQ